MDGYLCQARNSHANDTRPTYLTPPLAITATHTVITTETCTSDIRPLAWANRRMSSACQTNMHTTSPQVQHFHPNPSHHTQHTSQTHSSKGHMQSNEIYSPFCSHTNITLPSPPYIKHYYTAPHHTRKPPTQDAAQAKPPIKQALTRSLAQNRLDNPQEQDETNALAECPRAMPCHTMLCHPL